MSVYREDDGGTPAAPADVITDNAKTQHHHINGAGRLVLTPIRKARGAISNPNKPSGTEDWELDCEICRTQGVNLNDGHEIACCDTCGKWQHVWCHDNADQRAGRPKRDWNKVEFRCFRCQRPPPVSYQNGNGFSATPQSQSTNGVMRRKSSIQPQAPVPAPSNHQYHHTWQAYTPSPGATAAAVAPVAAVAPEVTQYGSQSTFASRPWNFDGNQHPPTSQYYQATLATAHSSTSHPPYQSAQQPVPLTPLYPSYAQPQPTNGQTSYRPIVQNGTHTPSHAPTGYAAYQPQADYSSAQSSTPSGHAQNLTPNGSYASQSHVPTWSAQQTHPPQLVWNDRYPTNGQLYSQVPYPSGGGLHNPSSQPHHYPVPVQPVGGPQPIYSKLPPTS